MPKLTDEQWAHVLLEGWDAIEAERVMSRERPQDIDTLAWQTMVASVGEAKTPWAPALAKQLHEMGKIERIAVLERIEAHGRAEAMR